MNDEFDCENIEGINEDERDNSDDESSDIEFQKVVSIALIYSKKFQFSWYSDVFSLDR